MNTIPILQMEDYLLVSIQVDLTDDMVIALQNGLTEKISSTEAKGVVIDISALGMVDSFIGRMIGTIASMSAILDAKTVVTGMQPSVAITLVELGLSLDNVYTALNINRGVALLNSLLKEEAKLADE